MHSGDDSLLRWSLVYVVSILAIAGGAMAAVQTYTLRETGRELAEAETALRSARSEADSLKRQLVEAGARLEEERGRRTVLEQRLQSVSGELAKSADERQTALKAAGETETATRHEREQRQAAEQALAAALAETERINADAARDRAELKRLEAQVARLKAAVPKQVLKSPAASSGSGFTTVTTTLGPAKKADSVDARPKAAPAPPAKSAVPTGAVPD